MRYFLRLLICGFLVVSCTTVQAALDAEVIKELRELSKELRSVATLVRKKQVADAEAVIKKVEDRLAELEIAEDEKDRTYKALLLSLTKAKNALPVSFEKHVAPIINDNCVRCHGANNPRGRLRLDTFNNMVKGGANKPLLVVGNPRNSLIMGRVAAQGAAMMPKGGERLSDDDINTLAKWIASGAAFDGENMDAPIGDSLVEKKPPVKVVRADGTETVSFKDDIAPWVVTVCLGCHGARNPRGGYQMTTFEQLLTDGDTGSTIVPGKPDESYIVDLVLRQDPIKMPAGNQTRIKRSQAMALEKWIAEGAHFDGGDSKAQLRSLVPTEAELAAAALAKMTDSEFADRRKQQAEELWNRVAPRETATSSETKNLYVYGNAPQSRLDEIAELGEQQVQRLLGKYRIQGTTPWRGRLIVFVAKTRFDYEEFNTVLMNRRTPRGVSGHARITANVADAYVAVFDNESPSADDLPPDALVKSLVAEAYLSREGANLPDWLRHGFGLLEAEANDSEYFKQITPKAADALRTVTRPATVFDNGTFSPEEVAPVGFLLTRYLMTNGGMAKLGALVNQLKTNANVGRAIQTVYGDTAANIAQGFLRGQ